VGLYLRTDQNGLRVGRAIAFAAFQKKLPNSNLAIAQMPKNQILRALGAYGHYRQALPYSHGAAAGAATVTTAAAAVEVPLIAAFR